MDVRRHLAVSLCLCSLLLFGAASPASAVDGVILIDQARALAGNVTPGDAPGFPVTLSQPGSYRLSGNLTVPAAGDGIVISADFVRLDLNGFVIGVAGGTGRFGVVTFGDGRLGGNRLGTVVRNGTVANFLDGLTLSIDASGGARAASTEVQQIQAFDNEDAIRVGSSAIVKDNIVMLNLRGIIVAAHSIVSGNTVSQNSLGFDLSCPSTVVGNFVRTNGIDIVKPFNVSDCTFVNNNPPTP